VKKNLTYLILAAVILLNNEYVIPFNNYVPKIRQIADSIGTLTTDYNLVLSFLYTLSTFYLSFVVFFLFSWLLLPFGNAWILISNLQKGIKINSYFLSLFAGLFLIIWFPANPFTPIVFLFLVYISDLTGTVSRKFPDYYRNKIQPALTPAANMPKTIKAFTKELFKVSGITLFLANHTKYLTILLLFEFFNPDFPSVGSLLRISYEYWNVPFLTTVVLLSVAVIAAMTYLLRKSANKLGIRNEN